MRDPGGVLDKARAIRESRRIDLEDIARSTKIQVKYLRAIESGDFDQLPSGAYRTSFIRQYARALDFDEGELLHALGRLVEEAMSPTSSAEARVVTPVTESHWRALLKRTKRVLDRLVAARSS